ncbi:MAG: BlaI/MecI/CopY family transcriptional regulator [Planctomycetota bacterium]
MVRPKARELTERELEVMRAFWDHGEGTAEDARKRLQQDGTKLAYVTVANVVRQLEEKGFLKQETQQRPFIYAAKKSFDDVSSRLVGNLLQKLFDGSRERMLVQMLGRKKLTPSEREFLRELLEKQEKKR